MSAEEMRIELETFVNAGLEEGWRGWPRKAQTSLSLTFRGWLPVAAESTGRAGRDGSTSFIEPQGALGTLRLFDWERGMIRAGARFASQQSRS
jgi:hypothetical protein